MATRALGGGEIMQEFQRFALAWTAAALLAVSLMALAVALAAPARAPGQPEPW